MLVKKNRSIAQWFVYHSGLKHVGHEILSITKNVYYEVRTVYAVTKNWLIIYQFSTFIHEHLTLNRQLAVSFAFLFRRKKLRSSQKRFASQNNFEYHSI